MPDRCRGILLAVGLAAALVTVPAVAQDNGGGPLEIRITQGVEGALPIAVVPFEHVGQTPPDDVSGIIAADLARSGRFAPMAVGDLPSQPSDFGAINFKDWRLVGMESLVIGRVAPAPDGWTIEFRLVDVFKGTQIAGFRIPAAADNLRLAAHYIADIIYENLLQSKGAFATRIAYVTVDSDKRYRLQVADSDGHNARTILESKEALLSPSWSPDGNQLAYVSFESGNSAIYLQDVRSGVREVVSSGAGIHSSPAFSPDGRQLALTMSGEGNPDIYVMNLANRSVRRLTSHPAIDTEARWHPDGQRIFFTSDRGGAPQIYEAGFSGKAPRRVTFDMGDYNARASVSPDGKSLAVVTRSQGAFRIAVLDLPSGRSQILSDTRLDESPSFAPNGSMIIYATMGRSGTELAAVSVDGRFKQRLRVARGQVREPAWGPLRK